MDPVNGRPYGLWVYVNDDTVGAAAAVGKRTDRLSLTQVVDVLGGVTQYAPPAVAAPKH